MTMKTLTLLAGLLWLAATSALAATPWPATPKAAIAALKAAAPGEVFQLPDGQVTLPALSGVLKAAPGIFIEPAPGAVVSAGPWLISASAGITVRGLTFTSLATGYAVQVAGSQRITFADDVFEAAVADREAARGLQIKSSQDITVERSRFRNLRYGLMGDHVDGFLAEDNDFRDIHGDAVRGWADSSHLTFRGTRCSDLYIPVADPTHVDCIQFWTAGATKGTTDLLIEGTVYTRGDGDPAQGVFLGNERSLPYERVTIRDNAIVGSTWNGIWVVIAKDVTITDNLVQHMAWSPRHAADYATVRPRIVIKSVDGGLVSGNAARIAVDAKTPLPPMSGNTEPADAAFGDYSALVAWRHRHDPPPDPKDVMIADLKAQAARLSADLSAANAALAAANDNAARAAGERDTALARIAAGIAALAR
jgi:hypothetical protein